MTHTLIIAEAACTWEGSLEAAFRSIEAAHACGADAWKTQWTSSIEKMAQRRGQASGEVYRRLLWPAEYHAKLKARCDAVGIEYMCTVFLPDDVAVIAPHVKRFKIAASECDWKEFLDLHILKGMPIILSRPFDKTVSYPFTDQVRSLLVVQKYPTPLEELRLSRLRAVAIPHPDGWKAYSDSTYYGLSDHTISLLTGALAVACGATIIEKHVRMHNTPESNPDYPHSLRMDSALEEGGDEIPFKQYVQNCRESERAMG